jgi:hypothetical protein
MPPGLVLTFLNWLATHLVIITLTGFLVAGLLLSGVLPLPGRQGAGPYPGLHLPDVGQDSDQVGPREHVSANAGVRPIAPQTTAQEGPSPIGGNLPIHGRSAPVAAGETAGRAEGGFRFRTEEIATADDARGDRDSLLQAARRAYWNNDLSAAESAYLTLIAAYPGDADAFGELGNLYEAMGMTSESLDAYYEAGMRLKAAGERAKLQQVIDLFERKKDPRVDELRR